MISILGSSETTRLAPVKKSSNELKKFFITETFFIPLC